MSSTRQIKRYITTVFYLLITATAGLAVMAVSEKYKVIIAELTSGSAAQSSKNYSLGAGVIGQSIYNDGIPKSNNYSLQQGYIGVQENTVNTTAPSSNLEAAFAYPSPIKPNSPGDPYYAQKLTFKELTPQAVIKIYNMAGELVATLNKTDNTVDFYAWDMANDSGQKLAGGVYIFLTTNPDDGKTKKGKFAIIK